MGETECWNHRGLHLFQLHAPLTFWGGVSGGKIRDTKQQFSHWLMFQKSSVSLSRRISLLSSLNVLLDFHNCLWGLRVDGQTWNMLARRPLQYKTRDMIRKKPCNIFSSLADTRRVRSECNAIQTFLLIAWCVCEFGCRRNALLKSQRWRKRAEG